MNRHHAITSTLKLLCLAGFTLLAASTSAAASTKEVEGVWSFGRGAVAIQRLSNGIFQGTVVKPIKFATCEHPVGEVMWTDMQEQPDGSFWGLHQWYHGACEPDPDLGPTAWRVLETANGEQRYLKVCLSTPGSSQPTIAADGTSAEMTYGCLDSTPLAELPETVGEASEGAKGANGTGGESGPEQTHQPISFASAVELPSSKLCFEPKALKIHLRNPKYDPIEEVVVRIDGKRVAHVRGGKQLKRDILVAKLPTGRYEIRILAVTVLKQRLSGHRIYHSCGTGSGAIKLHHSHKSGRRHDRAR
jgi:hypothetical protein